MTLEMYAKVQEANLLRREFALHPQSGRDWSRLRELEAEIKKMKEEGAPDPQAIVLDNREKTMFLGAETTGLTAEVKLNMSQIPTSIAHILDAEETPLLTAAVRYVGIGNAGPDIKRIRVTSFIEGYSARAINTLEMRRGAPEVQIRQLPTLFPHQVASINELTRATLNVTIEHLDSKELELQTTKSVWLQPRTTAVLELKDPSTGKWKDLSRYLAAYVTPNDPHVMEFLSKAKDKLATRSFAGYQPPKEGVSDQVNALFDALKGAGLSYVNSVIAFGDENSATIQRVRLPRESLRATNANCIDGVALFASLLEAISLNAMLVVLPGHALVGWQSWPDGDWKYLETTMIGSSTFAEACQAGEATVKLFESARTLVSVAEARTKYRITPMA
jgi:hypothetical protein